LIFALFATSAAQGVEVVSPKTTYIVTVDGDFNDVVRGQLRDAGIRIDDEFEYAFDGFIVDLAAYQLPYVQSLEYVKAIEEDVTDALCNLGNIYITGMGAKQGIPQDAEKGIALLAKGAELGSRQAAYTIGSYYGKGEIVPVNYSKAFFYLTLASLAQHDQAKRILLIMQHSVKDDFSKELEQAQHVYAKIENMRQLYKLL
jgi:TPR repeat protein